MIITGDIDMGLVYAELPGAVEWAGVDAFMLREDADDKAIGAARSLAVEMGWRLDEDAAIVALLMPGETRPYPAVDFTRELTVRLQQIGDGWYKPGDYAPVEGVLVANDGALPVIRETVTLTPDAGMVLESTRIEWLGADGSTHYSKTRDKWIAP